MEGVNGGYAGVLLSRMCSIILCIVATAELRRAGLLSNLRVFPAQPPSPGLVGLREPKSQMACYAIEAS